jgi:hypothetical protein
LAEPDVSAVFVAWLPARLGSIGATGRFKAESDSRFETVVGPLDGLVTCP